ncbi:hypothetical protein ILYODFUR_008892 [Ilyodon furcidens]|uniref:Uncharacterized protein n=1 Tax=Ilyodon furcidens TaxID=33524 RepID=A0ABV0VCZ1_9TELE
MNAADESANSVLSKGESPLSLCCCVDESRQAGKPSRAALCRQRCFLSSAALRAAAAAEAELFPPTLDAWTPLVTVGFLDPVLRALLCGFV